MLKDLVNVINQYFYANLLYKNFNNLDLLDQIEGSDNKSKYLTVLKQLNQFSAIIKDEKFELACYKHNQYTPIVQLHKIQLILPIYLGLNYDLCKQSDIEPMLLTNLVFICDNIDEFNINTIIGSVTGIYCSPIEINFLQRYYNQINNYFKNVNFDLLNILNDNYIRFINLTSIKSFTISYFKHNIFKINLDIKC